jgi:hypothetical protein
MVHTVTSCPFFGHLAVKVTKAALRALLLDILLEQDPVVLQDEHAEL